MTHNGRPVQRCRARASKAAVCWLLVSLGTAAWAFPLQHENEQRQPDMSPAIITASQHQQRGIDDLGPAGVALPFRQRRVSARHGGESARLRRWSEALQDEERQLFRARAKRLRRRARPEASDDEHGCPRNSGWRRQWWPRTCAWRDEIDSSDQDHDGLLRERHLEQSILDRRQQIDIVQDLWNLDDARYIVDITLGGQSLEVIVDTGSTDTFVYSVQPGNQYNGSPPPLFNNATASPLYDTGLTYNASYGSGNGMTNTIGHVLLSSVQMQSTSLSASNLTFADLYKTSNGVGASGLLGLGFPLNGNIWSNAILARYRQTNQAVPLSVSSSFYPLVPLLQAQGQISQSLFSLVLDRQGPSAANNPKTSGGTLPTSPQAKLSSGTLTIGAYPSGMSENQFTWSEVPVVSISDTYISYGFPTSSGNRWTTQIDAIFFNGARLISSRLQPEPNSNFALIDSGNPIMGIATDVLAQITNAWAANPSNYVLPCNTTFNLVFQIGGANFSVSREDILVPSITAIDSSNYGGYATTDCQAQMQPYTPTGNELGEDTSQTFQLGDVFLRNVITAYDYGSLTNALDNPPRIGFYSTNT